jgi:hypothetical protein
MSMKNSNHTIGNQTRYLPTHSALPQPTAPPAACPQKKVKPHKYFLQFKARISPCIIGILKLRSVSWVGYIACKGQKSNANHILVRKPKDIIENTYM